MKTLSTPLRLSMHNRFLLYVFSLVILFSSDTLLGEYTTPDDVLGEITTEINEPTGTINDPDKDIPICPNYEDESSFWSKIVGPYPSAPRVSTNGCGATKCCCQLIVPSGEKFWIAPGQEVMKCDLPLCGAEITVDFSYCEGRRSNTGKFICDVKTKPIQIYSDCGSGSCGKRSLEVESFKTSCTPCKLEDVRQPFCMKTVDNNSSRTENSSCHEVDRKNAQDGIIFVLSYCDKDPITGECVQDSTCKFAKTNADIGCKIEGKDGGPEGYPWGEPPLVWPPTPGTGKPTGHLICPPR